MSHESSENFSLTYSYSNFCPSIGSLRIRLIIVMFICIAITLSIIVRSAYIQILTDKRLERMARRQFQFRTLIQPRRGAILDRNNQPLAVSIETRSLAANPKKMVNKKDLAQLLSQALHIPHSKIIQKLNQNKEFMWVKRHLTDFEMVQMKKAKLADEEGNFIQGLWLVRESDRIYPHGQLASHILGTVNVDNDGIEGVELWKNHLLRGKVASVNAIKDARGRPTFIDAKAAQGLQDGDSIPLSIDAALQFEVEHELKDAIERTKSKAGIVIVMDSRSGEILALANEPTFNPNQKGYQRLNLDRRRNRALTDGFEPGSTLKAMLMISALKNGWKLEDQVWGEKGSFKVQGHKISEAMAHEKFEWVSLKKMIQVSSNVAAAKIALKLGSTVYLETLKSFGFGMKTGIGFPGEISGQVPGMFNGKEISSLTLANIGFGQGLLVTPLQMIRAFAAIQNGGWLVQPSLLKNLTKPTQSVQIFSEKICQEAIEALESVTLTGGTGKYASLPGFRVAGKTGTAQLIDPETKRYSHKKHISSFIGFPVGVNPSVIIFVSLVEPKGLYYATTTAAPLFREVLASVAARLSLPAQQMPFVSDVQLAQAEEALKIPVISDQINISQSGRIGPMDDFKNKEILTSKINSHEEDLSMKWEESTEGQKGGWIMPSLKGLSAREVFVLLHGHQMKLLLKGIGTVTDQNPLAGSKVRDGQTIRITLTDP